MAVASALHAGFQITVTMVVYPALIAVEPHQWTRAHGRHGAAITPIVGAIYIALLTTLCWAAWTHPTNPAVWVCAAGTAASLSATAFVAGPTHGRLTGHPEPALLRRLIRSDRVRAVASVVALLGGVAAPFV